jgi:hypothetical protein
MKLPPPEGNVFDNSSCPVKPHIIAQNNQHMGYVNNADRMTNTYSIT